MVRVLITGASGMLGKQIFNKLTDQHKYQIFTVSRGSLETSRYHYSADIGNVDRLLNVLADCQPSIVINCAAYINLDYCEKNRSQADLLHQKAVSVLSTYPSVQYLYYISTDSVFDGQRGNYTEEDSTNPLNYYALSKLNGEKEALKTARKAFIVRTNILGFNSTARTSLFEWAYQNLSQGSRINGFSNVFFNPLYVGDLAEMIVNFMKLECSPGIYNFASLGGISKYGLLFKIATVFGFNTNLINPTLMDIYKINTLRPLNTTLNTDKISNLGIRVPDVDICIHHLHKDFLKYGIRI